MSWCSLTRLILAGPVGTEPDRRPRRTTDGPLAGSPGTGDTCTASYSWPVNVRGRLRPEPAPKGRQAGPRPRGARIVVPGQRACLMLACMVPSSAAGLGGRHSWPGAGVAARGGYGSAERIRPCVCGRTGTKRRRSKVSPSEGNEVRREDCQEVAAPHSSVEAGERALPDPVERRGRRVVDRGLEARRGHRASTTCHRETT